jgi:hypothetical protein
MSTIGSIETEHLRNQQIEKGGKWMPSRVLCNDVTLYRLKEEYLVGAIYGQ